MSNIKKNIPAVRFSNFSNNYTKSTIGNYYKNLRTGMTPSRSKPDYFNGSNLWITSGELNYNYIDNTYEKITDEAIKDTNLVVYPPNTFFIAVTGLEAAGTRGRCAFNKIPATTNQSCLAFVETDKVHSVYLFYWYQKHSEKLGFKFGQGTKQQSFNNKIVEKFIFIHPEIEEQKKIASFLTAVDKKITQLQQNKTLLEQYKKGVMQQVFSQEIRFKDDDGHEYPDWKQKTLGEVISIGSGKDYKHLKKGNIPVYGTGGFMTFVDDYLFDGESVCIGRKGTIDKPVYLQGKFWTVDTLFYTHSFIDSKPKYIYYQFQKINWKKYNEASGVPSLSKKTIEKIEITIPSVAEQTKIANFLSAIDVKIQLVNTQLENTQQFKKGLLQQMFV